MGFATSASHSQSPERIRLSCLSTRSSRPALKHLSVNGSKLFWESSRSQMGGGGGGVRNVCWLESVSRAGMYRPLASKNLYRGTTWFLPYVASFGSEPR